MQFLDAISKMISVHFQGKPFNITVIQVYAPKSTAEEAEGSGKIYLKWWKEKKPKIKITLPSKDLIQILGRSQNFTDKHHQMSIKANAKGNSQRRNKRKKRLMKTNPKEYSKW